MEATEQGCFNSVGATGEPKEIADFEMLEITCLGMFREIQVWLLAIKVACAFSREWNNF